MPREPQSTRGRKPQPDGTVRVWSEMGMTVQITDDPPQYVKFSVGHERLAPDASEETLDKYAAVVDEYNERWANRVLRRLERLARRVERQR